MFKQTLPSFVSKASASLLVALVIGCGSQGSSLSSIDPPDSVTTQAFQEGGSSSSFIGLEQNGDNLEDPIVLHASESIPFESHDSDVVNFISEHESNADLNTLARTTIPNQDLSQFSFAVRNRCRLPIRFAIRYLNRSNNQWITQFWHSLNSSYVPVSLSGINTTNRYVYYYAETTNESGVRHRWSGQANTLIIGGSSYGAREINMGSQIGFHILTLNCGQDSSPPLALPSKSQIDTYVRGWNFSVGFPRSDYPYYEPVNQCGGEGITSNVPNDLSIRPFGYTLFTANFRNACDNHDRCYLTPASNPNTPIANRFTCDRRFHDDLLRECRSFQNFITGVGITTCVNLANTYAAAVYGAGIFFFDNAQLNARRYRAFVQDYIDGRSRRY